MSMTCFYTKDMSRWIPWVIFCCSPTVYWCRHIHACMTISHKASVEGWLNEYWVYDENFPIAIYNCQVPLNIKKKISYEAIELHCLKHNSPKTGWTKYNIFLSVIWKEYALARMNKVKHACSRKSKHEWILFYEFYEWIIMKYDMNLQWFIITEYEYYMINECE